MKHVTSQVPLCSPSVRNPQHYQCVPPPLSFPPPFLLLLSAAGTHASPVWPRLPGAETFRGTQIHSSQYRCADDFRGMRVAVVGAGNSGAQILAEVSAAGRASSALWSTLEEPSFLPMGLSGKEIFDTGEMEALYIARRTKHQAKYFVHFIAGGRAEGVIS